MILLTGIVKSPRGLADGGYNVTLAFNELAPDKAAQLLMFNNKFAYIALKEEPFSNEEQKALESLKSDEVIGKTPSQRIRNVLYILYDKDSEGFDTFDLYYRHKAEKYISWLKNKIDE